MTNSEFLTGSERSERTGNWSLHLWIPLETSDHLKPMGAFSLVAILLALVGIYGVISYGVSQRTQEIGIRMALGAEPEQVVSLMLKRGITMVLVGLGIGVVAAFGLTRFIESLLYNVDAQDPVIFGSVGVGFAVVAWLATYIPARRAAGVNPNQALRSE